MRTLMRFAMLLRDSGLVASVFRRGVSGLLRRPRPLGRRRGLDAAFQQLEPRLALATRDDVGGVGGGLPMEALDDRSAGPRVVDFAILDDTLRRAGAGVRAVGGRDRMFKEGDRILFRLTFNERVIVSGTPMLPVAIGGTIRDATLVRTARGDAVRSRSGGDRSLLFSLQVQRGDLAPNGLRVEGDIGLPAGAAIRDRAGNDASVAISRGLPRARVDAVGPRITEIGSLVVTPKSATMRVTFNEPVQFARRGRDAPTMTITIDGVQRRMTVDRAASRGTIVMFRYQAPRGERLDPAKVVVPNSVVEIGSRLGLRDAVGNAASSLGGPTGIQLSRTTIDENAGADIAILLTSVDPDGESDTHRFELVEGEGSDDNSRFRIEEGRLIPVQPFPFAAPFDFEDSGSWPFNIRLKATDSGGMSVEKRFSIGVTDVNERPTDIALSATSVAENAGANAVVGTLSTTDPDAVNTFTYALVSGTGDTDNAAFNISGNQLRVTASPDFETKRSYSVLVRSTDQGGLSIEKQFTIQVTNVNEAPAITPAAVPGVEENQTAVQTVTGSDPDAGTTLTYSISGGADAARFSINSTTGVLTFLAAPDFETPTDTGGNNVYDLTVQVSDGTLSVTQAVAVTVTGVNDAPAVTSAAAVSVAENQTAVQTVVGSDPDAGTTLVYSISGGADAAKFSIDSTTGVLTFQAAPDFESPTDIGGNNVYDLTVQVSDGTLSATQALAVTVTDVAETPTVTSAAAVSVAENQTAVQTVTGSGFNAAPTLVYSISGGADAAKFSINSTTGVLTFLVAPNFESPTDTGANNVYDLTVQVSDGNLSATQAVAVTVTNVNEAPTATVSFSTTFTNGDFSSSLTGWTAINARVRTGGADSVANWPTPVDTTTAPDGGIEATTASGTYSTTVTNGRAVMISSLSAQNNPQGSGAVVHGPVIVSNSAIFITSGATVQFDWEASGGGDAYDVLGYILNVDTGATFVILNATGASGSAVQPVTVVNFPVSVSGNYKFVFMSGSWDASQGTVLGARLSIDNVRVLGNAPPVITGAVLGADVDGDALSYAIATAPIHGTATLDPSSGGFSYTPNTPMNPANDSFAVSISDGNGGSVIVTVTVY